MDDTDQGKIMLVDVPRVKIASTLRHLKRKGMDLSRVWCYSYKSDRRIIHTLVMPYKYGYKLTKPARKSIQTFDDPIARLHS